MPLNFMILSIFGNRVEISILLWVMDLLKKSMKVMDILSGKMQTCKTTDWHTISGDSQTMEGQS